MFFYLITKAFPSNTTRQTKIRHSNKIMLLQAQGHFCSTSPSVPATVLLSTRILPRHAKVLLSTQAAGECLLEAHLHPPLSKATATVPNWRLQIHICIAAPASDFPEEFSQGATLKTFRYPPAYIGIQSPTSPFLINILKTLVFVHVLS